MDRLTERPGSWPCGCHGWGWRHHEGHCCITDLLTGSGPHCHTDIWDEYVKQGRDGTDTDEALRRITRDLHPGYEPAPCIEVVLPAPDMAPVRYVTAMPALSGAELDEFGTPPLPIGFIR